MERLADPSRLSGLYENDPRSMAKWMKSMGREMGDEMGEDFDVDAMMEEAMEEEGGKDGSGDSDFEPGGGSSALDDEYCALPLFPPLSGAFERRTKT